MLSSPSSEEANGARLSPLTDLLPLLNCPVCRHPESQLTAGVGRLRCEQCGSPFPVFGHGDTPVPWLFDHAQNVLEEWQARYAGFIDNNESEQTRLRSALDESGLSRLSRERLTSLLTARQLHTRQIDELLEALIPGGLGQPACPALTTTKIPQHQGLLSYYSNVFRDWAWNTDERQALFDCFAGLLPETTQSECRLLTLGAGAGWLPYQLHRAMAPRLSIALDINPLLIAVATHVTQGDSVALYEFPLAPQSGASNAVMQECAAEAPLEGDFFWLLADALNPPFAAQSFDMVFTPWLIDILPEDLRYFLPRVNRLLPIGGSWLNTGTLAFFHASAASCYSEAELLELMESAGFRICDISRNQVPYLQSPWSGHGRTERVLSFRAEKVADVADSPEFKLLPDWLVDTNLAVPDAVELGVQASSHLFQSHVLGAIDGRRSIAEISRLLAQHYQLQPDHALTAVQRLLAKHHEDARTSAAWIESI